jgi:hypothetical protein
MTSQAASTDLELMQAELDGANTPADSARLRALLESSTDARERFAGLQRVHAALARLPLAEPPDSLRATVLQAVLPRPAPPGRANPGARPQPRFGGSWLWPGLRLAGAFALGALVASAPGLLMQSGSDGPAGADPSDYAGTLAPRQRNATTVDDSRFESNLASGSFRMLDRHRLPVVEFEIDAGEPVEIDFECLRGCDGFQGYAHRSGTPSRVQVEERKLSFVSYGRQAAVVFVGRVPETEGATVRLRVLANRAVLHQDTLEFPAAPAG